jgi:hypothetical protein
VRVEVWFLPLVLLAVVLARPAWRWWLVLRPGTSRPAQALQDQPERISLVRVAEPAWRHPRTCEVANRQLTAAGFVESGCHVVREMPDLTLGLYAHPAERAYAVLYDHPHSDAWVEFVTRYEDGSLANYTTLEPMDAEVPEGSVHVAAPHLSVGDLWKRMLAERPQRPMRECTRGAAARDFERGYAESVERHKRAAAPSDPGAPPEDVEQVA